MSSHGDGFKWLRACRSIHPEVDRHLTVMGAHTLVDGRIDLSGLLGTGSIPLCENRSLTTAYRRLPEEARAEDGDGGAGQEEGGLEAVAEQEDVLLAEFEGVVPVDQQVVADIEGGKRLGRLTIRLCI